MDKMERYEFTKEEVCQIFEDKLLGKKISRVRFSSKKGSIVCEVGEKYDKFK